MQHSIDTEVDRNFEAFQHMLPDLLERAPGRYALLHDERLIELHDDSIAAFVAGTTQFGEQRFSVQEVTEQVDNLGFYSYAGSALQA
ncbi:hypothetical protein [Novosphingobium sp. PASSN1]|uniref:hypothetical protein n=1 Tax=Novosphingobium sp. PASSN1 TaxID=2015561 RepID=UPI000BD5484F|nr:hypothetical protein [Novosphingobium sp. PASSN1]OYU36560.1 MAG: hypothetical protein CFE35_04610 [Novosphingobium sp. PASSN1]